jgi:hypothetical protein
MRSRQIREISAHPGTHLVEIICAGFEENIIVTGGYHIK